MPSYTTSDSTTTMVNVSKAGALQENASDGGLAIKAFRPSKIPNGVGAEAVTPSRGAPGKTPALPLTPSFSPSLVNREDALKSMRNHLQACLAAERDAHDSLKAKLSGTTENTKGALHDDASLQAQDARVTALTQKLARAQNALENLQSAHDEYHSSAQKVKAVEARLQAKAGRPLRGGPSRLSSRDTSRLRRELDEATSMMSAAFRRVEQIEGITDHLISQLAETEAELEEVQTLHQEESLAHAHELAVLQKERDTLSEKLEAAALYAKEVEFKEEALRGQLTCAAAHADALATEVDMADAARFEAECRMETERATLTASLEDARTREMDLAAALRAKDEELAEATSRAAQGTPIGRGAKIVLPMALKRIQEAQNALRAEEDAKIAAEKELMRVQAEAERREAALEARLAELDKERCRQVAEKQESLESMTRAAAAAAKEAAIKQEAVNKAMAELASLDKERRELQDELQDATYKCLELESHLDEMEREMAATAVQLESATAQIAELGSQLEAVKADCDGAVRALESNRALSASLEASMNELKNQMEAKLSTAVGAIDSANLATTQAHTQLGIQDEFIVQLIVASAVANALAAEAQTQLQTQMAVRAAENNSMAASLAKVRSQMEELKASHALEMNKMDQDNARVNLEYVAAVDTMAAEVVGVQTQLKEAMECLLEAGERDRNLQGLRAALEQSLEEMKTHNAESEERAAVAERRSMSATAQVEEYRLQLDAGAAAQTILLVRQAQLEDEVQRHLLSVQELSTALEMTGKAAAEAQDSLATLQQSTAAAISSVQIQLDAVCRERDEYFCRSEQMQDDLHGLSMALELKGAEAEEARKACGASNEVVRLAFEKTRALQTTIKDKEQQIDDLEAIISQLQIAVTNGEDRQKALSEDVGKGRAELAYLRFEAARKESCAREVLSRTFEKVRSLEMAIAFKEEAIQELEAQLDCVEDNAAQLVAELAKKSAVLKASDEDRAKLAAMNAQAELEIARLRAEVEHKRIGHIWVEARLEESHIRIDELTASAEQLRAAAAVLQERAQEAEAEKKEALVAAAVSDAETAAVLKRCLFAEDSSSVAAATVLVAEGRARDAQDELENARARLGQALASIVVLEEGRSSLEGKALQSQQRIEVRVRFNQAESVASASGHTIRNLRHESQELTNTLAAERKEHSVQITQLKEYQSELSKEATAKLFDLANKEAKLAEASEHIAILEGILATEQKRQEQIMALKAELMEALELQRETAVTAKRLGAIREAELGRALRAAESRIDELLEIHACEAAAREARSAVEVKAAKDALATEHDRVDALAQERDSLKGQVGELESLVAKLKRDAARVEVLERANVEMSAQLAFALRSPGVVSHAVKGTDNAVNTKDEVKLQPHQNRFSGQAGRNGMWAAVVACGLAIVWSTAVPGGLRGPAQ